MSVGATALVVLAVAALGIGTLSLVASNLGHLRLDEVADVGGEVTVLFLVSTVPRTDLDMTFDPDEGAAGFVVITDVVMDEDAGVRVGRAERVRLGPVVPKGFRLVLAAAAVATGPVVDDMIVFFEFVDILSKAMLQQTMRSISIVFMHDGTNDAAVAEAFLVSKNSANVTQPRVQ